MGQIEGNRTTPTVLIVDDDMRTINGTVRQLERMGVNLIKTSTVTDALNVINDGGPIDCLITDIMMNPKGLPKSVANDSHHGLRTGVLLAELVKEKVPGIPIIGISAAKHPTLHQDNSPFDAFVSKATLFSNQSIWPTVHERFLARRLQRSDDWIRESLEQDKLLLYETKPELFGVKHEEFLAQRQQIEVSINETILRVLNGELDRLPELSPREFEEICALVLGRQGYDVTITVEGPDEGIDLIATSNDKLMKPVYLVQCKRNRIDRKVSVPVLRDLRCVVDDRRANGGIIMTSSYFTSKAQEYAERDQYRMELFDVLRLKSVIDHQSE